MRLPLAALVIGFHAVAVRGDEPPIDLAEYKTVATAKTTSIKELNGRRQSAHLGIYVESDADGLRIESVEKNSPAEHSGLKIGDRIVAMNGQPVTTVDALRTAVTTLAQGDRAALTVTRGGKSLAVDVRLSAASKPLGGPVRPILGIEMRPTGKGVRVERVTAGLPADRAGIRPGDILTRIAGAQITAVESVHEALGGFAPGDTVAVALARDGRTLSLDCRLIAETPIAHGSWDERQSEFFKHPVYNLGVVLIAFEDQKLNDKITTQEWDKAIFSRGKHTGRSVTGSAVHGSVHDYCREVSCDKLDLKGRIFAPVTVSKKRADYLAMPNRNAVFVEALDLVAARDGEQALANLDGLFFIFAGPRIMTSRGGVYWPHSSRLFHRGLRWSYFVCPEGGTDMTSISVICHEFGHMLGLPDLYARAEIPFAEGVGIWCTMSTGHGRDGKPLHYSAWCKEQLGWLKPSVIDPTEKQKLILAPIHRSPTECFKVLLRPDGSEYLLLENRLKRGFDRDLPGEGLLIWRVLDGKPVLEESHGITSPDGPTRFLGSVPYPSRSNNAFTPYTTPSSRPMKLGGLPVHITNIRKLPDGRIAFHIGYEYL
jgi:M6 family metalloprotease-like protein